MPSDPGFELPGWFVAVAVIIVVLGVASAVVKVSTARRIARRAGLDPTEATAVTLLDPDGLGATYVSSTLAARPVPPAPTAGPPRTLEDRLGELAQLRDRGVVTQAEYETERRRILGSI